MTRHLYLEASTQDFVKELSSDTGIPVSELIQSVKGGNPEFQGTWGYMLPDNLMPDISLWKMFSKWLRANGYDPDSFATYEHVFDDGKRKPVPARLYPNELMTAFNLELNRWIADGSALRYFVSRDKSSILPLKSILAELPPPDNN